MLVFPTCLWIKRTHVHQHQHTAMSPISMSLRTTLRAIFVVKFRAFMLDALILSTLRRETVASPRAHVAMMDWCGMQVCCPCMSTRFFIVNLASSCCFSVKQINYLSQINNLKRPSCAHCVNFTTLNSRTLPGGHADRTCIADEAGGAPMTCCFSVFS